MKIAQHLQIDKIYHQKEQKISYLGVYITNLGRESPGKAILGWKSTGLSELSFILAKPQTLLYMIKPRLYNVWQRPYRGVSKTYFV